MKKLYKSSGKCDDQQHYKVIIEAETVSTPKGFTDNIPMPYIQPVTVKNTSAKNHSVSF